MDKLITRYLGNWHSLWRFWWGTHLFIIFYSYISVLWNAPLDKELIYYFQGATNQEGLHEYPVINLWFIRLIYSFSLDYFNYVYPYIILLMQFALTRLIFKKADLKTGQFWVLCDSILCVAILYRLDILPAYATGLAIFFLFQKRNGAAGFMLAVASWIKIWPLILGAVFVDNWRKKGTWVRLLSFAASFGLIGIISYYIDGLDRLLSPLTYQTDRGIQVESVWATPFFIAHILNGFKGWYSEYATSKSFEIFGPGVDTLSTIVGYLLYVVAIFGIIIALVLFFSHKWSPVIALRFSLLLSLLLILCNKVLSPQYLYWIVPLIILGLIYDRSPKMLKIANLWIIISFFSIIIYPWVYASLVNFFPLTLIIIIIRNILLVYVTILSAQICFDRGSAKEKVEVEE